MDNITFLLTILSIIIPVMATIYATVYTVSGRVKNENRESHKPYLVLRKVETIKLDLYSYYLTLIGRNVKKKLNENVNYDCYNTLTVELILNNIGYGVASNIRFYDLLTGKQIDGTQESTKDQNQKLFTTFDIANASEKEVQAKILSKIDDKNMIDDHNRILCIYKDLNNNVYDFIISINIKDVDHYDFFSYQPSSRSYKKWLKENKCEYKKILNNYN